MHFLNINLPPEMRTPLYTGHYTGPKVSTLERFHFIQDTLPGLHGVHIRGVPLYTGHSTDPKVSTVEGFHFIQDTLPGPHGVHIRGVPLHYYNFLL